jgi:hypothetical protein
VPYQNRVAPDGRLIATAARGTLMGNRGVLHDENGTIVRHANGDLWIICVLEFRDRRRQVMAPRRYTHLFFLDEAVALAAGHRPCAECRRPAYRAYLEAVNRTEIPIVGAPALNRRLRNSRNAIRARVDVDALPDGAFVERDGLWLKWHRGLHRWTPDGYVDAQPISGTADLVTPDLSVTALRNGYRPTVHPSAAVTS